MKRDSLLYRITSDYRYLPDSQMADGYYHNKDKDFSIVDSDKFKTEAEHMRKNGSSYCLYSPFSHKLYAQGGIDQVLGYTEHKKVSTMLHGKMHPLSQFFSAIQLHLLLKFKSDEEIANKDKHIPGTGVVLFGLVSGGWLLMRREISLVKLHAEKTDIGVGEILMPVCYINDGLLPWTYPILSVSDFGKKNNTTIEAYLPQLVKDAEIFSQHQLNIIKAMKENLNYRHSLRTLAEENGLNYETLKTQTLRIRDKVNEHFKTTYTDSLSAIRFIILSNLV